MRARLPRLASVAVHSSPSGANPSRASSASTCTSSSNHDIRPPFPRATDTVTRAAPPRTLHGAGGSTGRCGQLGNAVQLGQQHGAVDPQTASGARTGKTVLPSQPAAGRAGARSATEGGRLGETTTTTDDWPAERRDVRDNDGRRPVAGPSGLHSIKSSNATGPPLSLRSPGPASSRRARGLSRLETQISLPTSEPELYNFLRRTKVAYTSLPPEWLASFHAHEHLADFVSSRTYRFLLRIAFACSNLRLVRTLLAEIKERAVALDEITKRAILRGYAGCGPRVLTSEDEAVRTALADELGRAAGEGATRPTRRRNFGQSGKGSNDLDELWKGWAVRGRDRRLREHVDALLRSSDPDPATAASRPGLTKSGKVVSSSPRARSTLRHKAAAAVPTRMQRIALSRPPILIPPLAHGLPGSDLTGLVQALVSTGRRAEAFDLAEAWLVANRPVFEEEPPGSLRPPDPPPPDETTTTRRAFGAGHSSRSPSLGVYLRRTLSYHSTAVVLLNILLKPLFLERAPVPVIRSFVTSFVETHSAARPAAPLLPDLVTLRTLVTGVLGSRTAWDRATSLVDWFGYQWGIPVADPSVRARHRFLPPSEIEADRLAIIESPLPAAPCAVAEGAQTGQEPLRLLLVKPHAVVPPDVALLLLRHAADQYARDRFAAAPSSSSSSSSRRRLWRQGVRAWWRGFDRDSTATDVWTGQKARAVVDKAVKVGLFKPKQSVRARATGKKEDEPPL
ncbi:hypothetical protein JCM3774_006016 [Rhodotorula dairenensis]